MEPQHQIAKIQTDSGPGHIAAYFPHFSALFYPKQSSPLFQESRQGSKTTLPCLENKALLWRLQFVDFDLVLLIHLATSWQNEFIKM